MIDKKELFFRLNSCASKNMSKALFSLFLMMVFGVLVMSFFIGPALMLATQDTVSLFKMVVVFVLLFMALLFSLFLQFGYAVLLLRLERKQFVTLGFLFTGFRSIRNVLPLILILATCFGIVIGLIQAGDSFLQPFLPAFFKTRYGGILETAAMLIVLIAALCVLYIRFVFVFFVRYDHAERSVAATFKKSAQLMKHHFFDFLSFVLRAGGRFLIIAIGVFVVDSLIPASLISSSHSMRIVSFVLDFVYFVNFYTALVRMYLAVPVLYDYLLEMNGEPPVFQSLPAE